MPTPRRSSRLRATLTAVALLGAVATLPGCWLFVHEATTVEASSSAAPEEKQPTEPVAEEPTEPDAAETIGPVIETSGPRPQWVDSDEDSYEQNGRVFFRAMVDRGRDLDRTLDWARIGAIAAVGAAVTTEVETALGLDDGSRTRSTTTRSRASVRGVVSKASYWDLRMITRRGRTTPSYRVYALVSISRGDLKRAQAQAAEDALTRLAGERHERAKARLGDFMKRLDETP